jgi:hypothetical protein
MSTVPDPMGVHWPEMIDNQEENTACWTDSNHPATGWPEVAASVS